MEYKDTGIECWDYTLGKAEDDTVYIRREGSYIAEVEHNGWRFVDVSEEQTDKLNQPVKVSQLLSDYRFWQWNGRKVSLIGCMGKLCETAYDAPQGTPTPDLRGYVYQVGKFDTDGVTTPYIMHPDAGKIPAVFSNIGSLCHMVAKVMGKEELSSLCVNPYHNIICMPLAKLILSDNKIMLDGRVQDLRAISKLSPHQQDDPEELLLNKLLLDDTVDGE